MLTQKSSCYDVLKANVTHNKTFFKGTTSFNSLMHVLSILNRKILYQNEMHSIEFLPWFEEMNLGLAWTACKLVTMVLKKQIFPGMCKCICAFSAINIAAFHIDLWYQIEMNFHTTDIHRNEIVMSHYQNILLNYDYGQR